MTPRFEWIPTPLAGLMRVRRLPVGDGRGYFERLFCADAWQALLGERRIVQINHTRTARRGTARGLHFQHPPHGECKIVQCLQGEVFDVVVDLRRDSPTFLRWHGEVLGGERFVTLWVPEGFAHGFQTLTDGCEMLYLHTAAYRPEAEGGVHVQDPALGIRWPLPLEGLSPRDASHPWLSGSFAGVVV
ncbi:MAG: dTDP-4-dehydrorhamnose 3,5-epimerase family protein [Magnetococcales bacterium]|nr:dTDP-4-dehydrorhamnose 3,5-epimerase family protein [Magnetococcales bacterium]